MSEREVGLRFRRDEGETWQRAMNGLPDPMEGLGILGLGLDALWSAERLVGS